MMTIENYLQRNASLYPDKIAIICRGEEITYSRLWQLVESKAMILREQYQPHHVAAIRTSQSIDFLVTYFALHVAEAVALPLEHDIPQGRFEEIANRYACFIAPEEVADTVIFKALHHAARRCNLNCVHGRTSFRKNSLHLCSGDRYPVFPQPQSRGCKNRGTVRHRVGHCNTGEPEEMMQQIQAGDQQHPLAQHGDERGLKGLSRSLQKITAQVIKPEERTRDDQPSHQLAAESEIVCIFQKQADERFSAKKAGKTRHKAKAQSQGSRDPFSSFDSVFVLSV